MRRPCAKHLPHPQATSGAQPARLLLLDQGRAGYPPATQCSPPPTWRRPEQAQALKQRTEVAETFADIRYTIPKVLALQTCICDTCKPCRQVPQALPPPPVQAAAAGGWRSWPAGAPRGWRMLSNELLMLKRNR